MKKSGNKQSILNLEGLGSDMWKGIDAQDYIQKERSTWDKLIRSAGSQAPAWEPAENFTWPPAIESRRDDRK